MPLLHEVRDNSSDAGQDKNLVGTKPLVSMITGMMLSRSGGIVEENTPTPTKVKMGASERRRRSQRHREFRGGRQ